MWENRTDEQINLVNKCITSMTPILEKMAHNLIKKGYSRHGNISINLGYVSVKSIDEGKIPVIDVVHEGFVCAIEKFHNYNPNRISSVFGFIVSRAGSGMVKHILKNIPNGTKIFGHIRRRKMKGLSTKRVFEDLPYVYPLSLTDIIYSYGKDEKRYISLEREFLTSSISPERDTFLKYDQELLSKLLSTLSEREKDILENRYGINKDMEKYSLRKIGKKHGISGERARQIQLNAEKKLKNRKRLTGLVI